MYQYSRCNTSIDSSLIISDAQYFFKENRARRDNFTPDKLPRCPEIPNFCDNMLIITISTTYITGGCWCSGHELAFLSGESLVETPLEAILYLIETEKKCKLCAYVPRLRHLNGRWKLSSA